MMDLTQIVAEMKKDARQPAIVIAAHEQTLAALVELANRLEALEAEIPGENAEPVRRGPGRPRKEAFR
jgi:hypothetical protein